MDEMDEMDHKGQGMGLETLRDGGWCSRQYSSS
jgi:hypothetical protein